MLYVSYVKSKLGDFTFLLLHVSNKLNLSITYLFGGLWGWWEMKLEAIEFLAVASLYT